MSEYWKSTPKYWCKHCSVFVRETKLERANHEATAKHQGAVKRALRDLHRGADQKEREKERAKREVDRLNGVVSGGSSSAAGAPSRTGTAKPSGVAYAAATAAPQASQADRQKQLEQLAELGVNIPTELRSGMALAGEWTVTSTRVIEQDAGDKEESKEGVSSDGRATGVKRERERTEDEKESEEAIKGLFKKRKWGIDSKTMPAAEDAELEALLTGSLVKAKKEETEQPRIKEEESQLSVPDDGSEPTKDEHPPSIKKELDEDEASENTNVPTKGLGEIPPATSAAEVPVVAFKKRKPKNIRQK